MVTADRRLILTTDRPELLGRALRFAVSPTMTVKEEAQAFMSKQVYVQSTSVEDLFAAVWSTDLARMNVALAHETTFDKSYFDEHGPLILDRHVVAMLSPILENTKKEGVKAAIYSDPVGGNYILDTAGFEMEVPSTKSARKPYELRRSIKEEDIADTGTDAALDFENLLAGLKELGVTRRATHNLSVRGLKPDQVLQLTYKGESAHIKATYVDRPFRFLVQAQHMLSAARELAEFGIGEGGLSLSRKTDKLARMWTTLYEVGPWFAMCFLWRTG